MRVRALLMVSLVASPVHAMTPADLLAAEKRFATGYIFGAIEYQIGIPLMTISPHVVKKSGSVCSTANSCPTTSILR